MIIDDGLKGLLDTSTVGSNFAVSWKINGVPGKEVNLHCVEATNTERRFSVFSHGVWVTELTAVKTPSGWEQK